MDQSVNELVDARNGKSDDVPPCGPAMIWNRKIKRKPVDNRDKDGTSPITTVTGYYQYYNLFVFTIR